MADTIKVGQQLKPVEPSGRFSLRLKLGDDDVSVNPTTLKELIVVQDLEKFSPMFTLSITDTTGDLIHTIPFDRGMSKVSIELADDYASENRNSWDFMTYRRKPISDQSQPYGIYTANGLLDVDNIHSPSYCRAFNQNVLTSLGTLAEEMGVILEGGASIDIEKNLIQASWSNLQFLNYLASNFEGVQRGAGYQTFLKRLNNKTYLVFKNLEELMKDTIKYKFILRDTAYEDLYPIFEYSMLDNYKVHTVFSAKTQRYGYFNYDTSTYVEASHALEDFYSLTDFFLVDKEDNNDSNISDTTGRTNDFTNDFDGQVRGSYHTRLNNLVKLWITTKGMPNICPGDTVGIFFPQGIIGDKMYSYQYSGFWLVQRVVHNVSDIFLTKLLLTRTGIDTDVSNTLIAATKKKMD